MKKVIVHCSTNCGTSNFGDVLFAYMILKRLTEEGVHVSFYELSPYVSNYLYHIHKLPEYHFRLKEVDGIIYFAGGYFGEQRKVRIGKRIVHYLRFMPAGMRAVRLNKKIAVIGIGAGDYLSFFSKHAVQSICRKSSYITTRDRESTDFLKSIGVSNPIETCSDIAQTIDFHGLFDTEQFCFEGNKKYIFLHTNYQTDVSLLFAKGLKDFFNRHPDVMAIVGADSTADIHDAAGVAASILGGDRVKAYPYSTPDNLCRILGRCDLVMTYKLHVGILSATMGRSVIAFPKHEKVQRYYRQIGESGRCVNYCDADTSNISRLVEYYFGKPLELTPEIKALAQRNWEIIDSFLADT